MTSTDPSRWRKPQIVKWLTNRLVEDPFLTPGQLHEELTGKGRRIARSTFSDYLAAAKVKAADQWRTTDTEATALYLAQWENLLTELVRRYRETDDVSWLAQARMLLRDRAHITGVFADQIAAEDSATMLGFLQLIQKGLGDEQSTPP